jgi:hypothetical protein
MQASSAIEAAMVSPPKLKEVLDTPLLYDAFYWWLVSRFAPENLMFHQAVLEYQAAVKDGRLEQVIFFFFLFSLTHDYGRLPKRDRR